ncbi:hypothetical protein MKX01_028969 [Papaver californicum]|nr:hypothetical protein MKX01_028969 [Papaver californicum]
MNQRMELSIIEYASGSKKKFIDDSQIKKTTRKGRGPKVHLGPVPPPHGLMKAEVSWMSTMRKGNLAYEERVLRKVRSTLNKMTVEKYYVMKTQLIDLGITILSILQGATFLIFNKAVYKINE